MKIALAGFGKMGHSLKDTAEKRGHTIVITVDPAASDASVRVADSKEAAAAIAQSGAEGIIEFTHPSSVLSNIASFLPLKLPLVVGTTGWNEHISSVKEQITRTESWLLTSANFSIGVNMFYRMISHATQLMDSFDEYDCAVWEAHHNQKADSPSGTALEIARRILEKNSVKKTLVTDAFRQRPGKDELHVSSTRIGSVPGIHTVFFDSPHDSIEITHTSHSRDGLASGAVLALEWLAYSVRQKKLASGMYSFDDVLNSL